MRFLTFVLVTLVLALPARADIFRQPQAMCEKLSRGDFYLISGKYGKPIVSATAEIMMDSVGKSVVTSTLEARIGTDGATFAVLAVGSEAKRVHLPLTYRVRVVAAGSTQPMTSAWLTAGHEDVMVDSLYRTNHAAPAHLPVPEHMITPPAIVPPEASAHEVRAPMREETLEATIIEDHCAERSTAEAYIRAVLTAHDMIELYLNEKKVRGSTAYYRMALEQILLILNIAIRTTDPAGQKR